MNSTQKPRHGSANSSPPALSQKELSINAPSSTCVPPISTATPNAISSPASAGGATPCASPPGPTTGQSGPEAAPASRSPMPDCIGAPPTSAISGPCSSISSVSAALQSSLASRLRARLPLFGSMEYAMTWKERVTPSGRRICALRARAHPKSGRGSTGWATPQTRDHFTAHTPQYTAAKKADGHGMANLNDQAMLSGWPTPTRQDGASSGVKDYPPTPTHHAGTTLTDAANMAGWPTPTAGTPAQKGYNEAGNKDSGRKTVQLAGWVSPRASEIDRHRSAEALARARLRGGSAALEDQVHVAGWVTPSSRDWKDSPGMATTGTNPDGSTRSRVDQLPRQAQLASGPLTTLSPAPTARRGALNPAFSRWLMGYPVEWCQAALQAFRKLKQAGKRASQGCEATETRLCRSSRRSSSKPSST